MTQYHNAASLDGMKKGCHHCFPHSLLGACVPSNVFYTVTCTLRNCANYFQTSHLQLIMIKQKGFFWGGGAIRKKIHKEEITLHHRHVPDLWPLWPLSKTLWPVSSKSNVWFENTSQFNVHTFDKKLCPYHLKLGIKTNHLSFIEV